MKCPHCGFSWDNEEWEEEKIPTGKTKISSFLEGGYDTPYGR